MNTTQNQRGNSELKPCNCDCPMPWGYKTYFLGIPISTTINCVWCRIKITRPTEKMAVKAWNRRATDERAE